MLEAVNNSRGARSTSGFEEALSLYEGALAAVDEAEGAAASDPKESHERTEAENLRQLCRLNIVAAAIQLAQSSSLSASSPPLSTKKKSPWLIAKAHCEAALATDRDHLKALEFFGFILLRGENRPRDALLHLNRAVRLAQAEADAEARGGDAANAARKPPPQRSSRG